MPFDCLRKNASVFLGLIILIISYGCTQLTPGYLTASAYEKSLILYNEGSLVEAREKLAEVKKGESDYKAAQELLSKINILASRLAEVHREIGEEYEKAGLYSLAKEEYKTAIKLDPASPFIHKKLEEAEGKSLYLQKKEVKTNGPEVLAKKHYRAGVVFFESKQFAKAIDEFNIAIKLNPAYGDAEKLLAAAKRELDNAVNMHLKNGIDYFQKEELELAIKEWDLALELDPFNKTARDYKAKAETIMEKMKDIRERSK